MMVLHTARTTNGRKPLMALEELGVDYELRWVDLSAGEQREPEFLAMNPYGKIPVVQSGELTVWESGAILLHLAERFGGLLPSDPAGRLEAIQLSFLQVASIGPHGGRLSTQWHRPQDERNVEAFEDSLRQINRVHGTLEQILSDGRRWFAGDYSIADIMSYPWISYLQRLQVDGLEIGAGLEAWVARVAARPATKRAFSLKPG